MKKLLCVVTTLMALTFLIASGCAKKELDFSKVEAAFRDDQSVNRTLLDKGIAAAKAGQYQQASEALQKVVFGTRLTKEQRLVLLEFNRQINARIKAK